MFGRLDKFIVVFLTGSVISYVLAPWVGRLASRLGAVDLPNGRRPRRRPTPRGGGLAVFVGFHAACLAALALPWPQLAGSLGFAWWWHFALASLVLLVVGIADDIHGLRPLVKLGGQVLAAVLVVLSGAHFQGPLGLKLPWFLDALLVIIWIVTVINAFGLIQGLDGLAPGLALISATGLCGVLVLDHLPGDAVVVLGFIGACLGFLRFNFHPASILLGNTGSMFLGFTLAVVALQTFTKSVFVASSAIPMLILGVPIYDEALAVWRRSVRLWLGSGEPRENGKNGLMEPDAEHLHHRLVKSGLSTRRATALLHLLNGSLLVFGILIAAFKSHAAGIFLLGLLAVVYLLMRHLAVIELRATGKLILYGLRRPSYATLGALAYPFWDMLCLAGALALSMRFFEVSPTRWWHEWLLDLPVWATPTLSLLAISRVYLTVWRSARLLDVLSLAFTLMAGLVLSLSLALLIDPSKAANWLVRASVVGMLGHPAMLGARLVYRFTEEFVIYLKHNSQLNEYGSRVLLYGAGSRCQLFLRESSFVNSPNFDENTTVGLIDDEPSLHSKWVYGHQVLGGLGDLPRLIAQHRITDIIITAELRPESLAGVQDLARQQAVQLSEWRFEHRKIEL
jgi:UDP-N-acetylmuramyl pentapeptide phosphotransferase/UDP-N-acetylglucosamine-1-phosphate transferase